MRKLSYFEPTIMDHGEIQSLLTMQDPGHFKKCRAGAYSDQLQKLFSCFSLIHRWNEYNKLEFMAVKYLSNDKGIQIKLPGGGSEKGETPVQTILRELAEETLLGESLLESLNLKPIVGWKNFNTGEQEPSNYKIFFLSEDPLPNDVDVHGKCADVEIIEKIWLKPMDAFNLLYQNHRDAFLKSVDSLMLKDRKYGYELMNLAN